MKKFINSILVFMIVSTMFMPVLGASTVDVSEVIEEELAISAEEDITESEELESEITAYESEVEAEVEAIDPTDDPVIEEPVANEKPKAPVATTETTEDGTYTEVIEDYKGVVGDTHTTYYENNVKVKVVIDYKSKNSRTEIFYNYKGATTDTYHYKSNYLVERIKVVGTTKDVYAYRNKGKLFSKKRYLNSVLSSATYYENDVRVSLHAYRSNGTKISSNYYKNGYMYVKHEYAKNGSTRTYTWRYYASGERQSKMYYTSAGKRKFIIRMDKKGYVLSTTRYNKWSKAYEFMTFYPKTDFSTRRKHIEYSSYSHYQKNGVRTGVTKKWYYSSQKIKKIDASVSMTYYNQYAQKENKRYSCKYGGNLNNYGCIRNSFAMQYSAYFNNELSPLAQYRQGDECFADAGVTGRRNGLNTQKMAVSGSDRAYNPTIINRNNAVPNGKSTFKLSEAIVDYGMPVQLMLQNTYHRRTNFPGHSVIAYRYVYENGVTTIYAKDPGAARGTVNLKTYLRYGAFGDPNIDYRIKHVWAGGVK